MHLGGWLRSLGLERYQAAFRDNEIDEGLNAIRERFIFRSSSHFA
jgi:hypothetical protein